VPAQASSSSAADYRSTAYVVYGHTPVPEAVWLNRTICIDTGCVFGGKLTALRSPEKESVDVETARQYYEPAKRFPQAGARPAPVQRSLALREFASDSNPYIGSSKRSPSTGSTSAFLACWRWRSSRSIPGSEKKSARHPLCRASRTFKACNASQYQNRARDAVFA